MLPAEYQQSNQQYQKQPTCPYWRSKEAMEALLSVPVLLPALYLCFYWLLKELDQFPTRPQDRFAISEEDKRIYREELFPCWEKRSDERFHQRAE